MAVQKNVYSSVVKDLSKRNVNPNNSGLAGYSGAIGLKNSTGGIYAGGIEQLNPTLKNDRIVPKANMGVGVTGGGTIGGVTREGVITGSMGVTKLPSINPSFASGSSNSNLGKYADFFKLKRATPSASGAGGTGSTGGSISYAYAGGSVGGGNSEESGAQGDGKDEIEKVPASYEEYYEQQKKLLDERKAQADKEAEVAKQKAAVDAQASYAQNKASYGANAEQLAQMGLTGSGYSDYINAQAYAQKRADVQQANATEQAAKVQNRATYEDALSELNANKLQYDMQQQEKADAKQEQDRQQRDNIYATLWEQAMNPDSNLTEEGIESMGKAYGLDDAKIEELKSLVKSSTPKKDSNIYANLLSMANNGTYTADQIAAIAEQQGLSEKEINDLRNAADTYKNNIYKSNYSNYMAGVESGDTSKNLLDTALKNDEITQEQYDDLLDKFQTSAYSLYSQYVKADAINFDTDEVESAYKNGDISQEHYEKLKQEYLSALASAITSESLFYSGNGGNLDEKGARALVEKLKNTGWISDDIASKMDSLLASAYRKDDDDGGCYAKGTLIAIPSGGGYTQMPVENLNIGDNVLVFNHETGELDVAPISYIFYDGKKQYDVLRLDFDDDTSIEVLFGHSFFDTALKKYVLINAENVCNHLGHKFYAVSMADGAQESKVVKLTGFETYKKDTECYAVLTAQHINCFANGLLNITDDENNPSEPLRGFTNVFELDDNYKIDEEKRAADIEKYGLFAYDDWKDYATEEQFYAFNGAYLKVAIGKELITAEEIVQYINHFLNTER